MGNKAGDRKKHEEVRDKGGSSSGRNVKKQDSSSCSMPMKTMLLTSNVSPMGDTSGGVLDGSVVREEIAEHSLVELMMARPEGLAVVIIDMQTTDLLGESRGPFTLLEQQQSVLACARKLDATIIDISTSQSGVVKTRPELIETIAGYEGHHQFVKGTQNAFDPASYDEESAHKLMALIEPAKTVVVMGFDADVCVRGTIFGGTRPANSSEKPEVFKRLLEIKEERSALASSFGNEEISLEEYQSQEEHLKEEEKALNRDNRMYIPGLLSMGKIVLTGDAILAGGRKHPAYGADKWLG